MEEFLGAKEAKEILQQSLVSGEWGVGCGVWGGGRGSGWWVGGLKVLWWG